MSSAVAKREPTEVAEQQDRQVDAIKRILSQRTPDGEIRVRVGRGGMKLKYTDGAYVIRTLNAAFGWDWDFVADCEELLLNNGKPFEVKVRGSLTVRLGGRAITKTQYGCQPIEMLKNGEAPVSIGDAYKGAATDAMKKCASLLGIALDLYDSDYKAEKYADDTEPEPPAPRQQQSAPIGHKPTSLGDLVTPKQLWMIRNLAREIGCDAEALCAGRFNLPLEQINKRAASELIEFLREQSEAKTEPEPERTVKLEGAQPTQPQAGELPANLKGQAGQVVALAKALKWGEAELVGLIQQALGAVVYAGKLAETLEFMTGDEHRELIRVLKGKLQGGR